MNDFDFYKILLEYLKNNIFKIDKKFLIIVLLLIIKIFPYMYTIFSIISFIYKYKFWMFLLMIIVYYKSVKKNQLGEDETLT